jgi:protein involved in polysaccharide export with SLBB domain
VPASVNVVGAVYDQNSFLYKPQRRVGDYLQLSGGPNRDADKNHIFVIRADGSVYSRERANGLWGNNFAATPIYPGDSIVVPEKVLGTSVLRSFINWSQVFSQVALGAAAISVLHNN